MENNEIFRTFLHLTGIGKDKDLAIKLFKLGGVIASSSKIKAWRTDLDNDRASFMPDDVLRGFFKGAFEYRDQQFKKGINVFNFL